MPSTAKVHKRTVALFLNRKSIPQLIADARHYVTQITGNANFPAPNPPLADITTEINNLDAAYNLSLTRARGSVSAMHAEATILMHSLKALGAYVELQANKDPENAAVIIEGAGMTVKKTSTRPPRVFNAKQGDIFGTIKLDTKAVKRGSYIYQLSTKPDDPNSWTEVYQGTRVKFTTQPLTEGTTYYFRTATIDKNGKSDWSGIISIMAT
ncbi:MAG: fibronectin type III domain-containing protein [Bacteroidia bacterium]